MHYVACTEISVASTERSVKAAQVNHDASLVFLAKVLAAIANAHSPKTLAKELANAFHAHDAIVALEVGGILIARAGAEWRIVERERIESADIGRRGIEPDVRDAIGRGANEPRGIEPDERDAIGRRAIELVPNLRIATSGALPDYFANRAFLDALAQVIETARRQIETIERLAAVSRQSFAKGKELREAIARAEHGNGLVARSSRMQGVLARVQLVARHPTTVLVTGESGTGKELVARELHRLSPRSHRPFLMLNCGAIPPELVESELFGHERGAFTGADRAHAGIFERANGGTLLLDELGDLPLAAQAKLLRVLQERTVRRVGGTHELPFDVRVIAATHRDLRSGAFREDLYYRLAVFQIEVPPLRARREDIAPLATALIAELAQKLGVPPTTLSTTDLAALESYDWPGNVRELRNVLETILVIGELPAFAHRAALRANTSLDAATREAIEDALRSTHGKIYGASGAAARLGLPPATLQSKMKKLGIDRVAFTRTE
jgi:formate hydrogenlyase transcriptional activator